MSGNVENIHDRINRDLDHMIETVDQRREAFRQQFAKVAAALEEADMAIRNARYLLDQLKGASQ